MWEVPQNCDGGRWTLSVEKKFRTTSLDVYWLNTLLALIGDQFMEDGQYVNGVWVNVRAKGDKISLWTKHAKNAEIQLKIG
jgi:translation initiation factor 4E